MIQNMLQYVRLVFCPRVARSHSLLIGRGNASAETRRALVWILICVWDSTEVTSLHQSGYFGDFKVKAICLWQ